jgi:RHS repeat-associated protein
VYPISATNPLNQTTLTNYDYALGLPQKVTDPNNVSTGATYDALGRMLAVCAPGDWDETTCPATGSTLSIVYNDYAGASSPFNIALTQKIDNSTSKQEVRYFDGTSKLIQVQQPGSQINVGTVNIVVDTVYDSFGRAAKQSKPFFYTGAVAYQPQALLAGYSREATTTTYDDWSRVSAVTEPDTTYIAYSYGFVNDADVGWSFQTTQTNAKQQTTLQLQDAFGRVRKVIPSTENSAAIAPALKYNYDALDRLSDVYQGSTNTHFVYDEAGRKTSMTDPDMGTWNYAYDPQNNLIAQTDARQCVTTLAYDELNRLTNKAFSGGINCTSTDSTIHYYYDDYTSPNLAYTPGLSYAVGQRTGITDGSGRTVWEYDLRGRKTLESKSVLDETTDLGTYVTQWTYNSADLVTSMTYPNSETVQNTYQAQGALYGVGSQMMNYVPSTLYDLNGRVTTLNLGLGNSAYSIRYDYWVWNQNLKGGRLNWIKAGTASDPSSLQYLGFDSDPLGNLSSISDYKSGPDRNLTQTQTFQYDALNRLKNAAAQGGGGTAYGDYALENYVYTDPQTGNLTQKANSTLSYAAQSGTCPGTTVPAKIHAVTSMTGTGLTATYCYDPNGNMSQRTVNGVTTNFNYDAANNLTSISGSTNETYVFDGDGNRVILKSGTTTTVYIGQYFEVTIDPNIPLPTPPGGSGGGTGCPTSHCIYLPVVMKMLISEPPAQREWHSYFYAGSNRVAMRVQGGARGLAGDVFYVLDDFLGSTSLTIKADTLVLTELRYKPWGETRYENGSTQTSFRYTGQRLDNTTGLYWYNSRWYDPSLGRFIQPDTIVPNPKDTKSFDRFAYVNNNPINFKDPTGHVLSADDGLGTTTGVLTSLLQKVYGWVMVGDWNENQLNTIRDAAWGIRDYISAIRGDDGVSFMRNYMGGTHFYKDTLLLNAVRYGINNGNITAITPDGYNVHLPEGFENFGWPDTAKGMVIHEMGHILDNRFGPTTQTGYNPLPGVEWTHLTQLFPSAIEGGGPADALISFMGGTPNTPRCAGGVSLPDNNNLYTGNFYYGNNSSADYFAHTFSVSIISPNNVPKTAKLWMDSFITLLP